MTRAEMRRQKKQEEKDKTATYNFTKAQLDAVIEKEVRQKLEEMRDKATEDAIGTAMVLLFTIPMKVLIDHYWTKSYRQKLPKFADYMLEYTNAWRDGELDIDKAREELWEYAGLRLEENLDD